MADIDIMRFYLRLFLYFVIANCADFVIKRCVSKTDTDICFLYRIAKI